MIWLKLVKLIKDKGVEIMKIGDLVTKAVIEQNNILRIELANDMGVVIKVDKDFTSGDIDKVLEVLDHVDETYEYQTLKNLVHGAYEVAKSELIGPTYMIDRFYKIVRIIPFYYDNELRYTVVLNSDGREICFNIDVPMLEVIKYKLEQMR